MKDWPFQLGEKVKLYWVDKPYKLNNKWMLDAYFKGHKEIKKMTFDWATIHFLAFGRYYKDGNINNSEIRKNATIVDLDLSSIVFEMIEDFLEIEAEGSKKEIPTKVFVGYKDKVEYRIPALEIIRAIIATNRFLLNRIVELDSLDKYFIYSYDKQKNLHINFFDEYEEKLLNTEYVKHLAWIITNESIIKMFNQVGKNLWLKENISFDFLFHHFNVKARIRNKKHIIRILEVIEFREKEINAEEIFISSRYLKNIRKINQPKKRKYRLLKETDDKKLDPKVDGAKNSESDFVDTSNIKHIYTKNSKINRIRSGESYVRDEEDEKTKLYEIENEALRTTADTGGMDKAKGIEYKNVEDVSIQGELEEFIEIMKLLKNKPNIKDVQLVIKDLPEGKKGKKFSKLHDGENKRQYVVGKITMNNGKEVSLIEVEREERSLSILLLYAVKAINWGNLYLKVTLGLVNKNGTWDSQGLKRLEGQGVFSNRIRHKSDKSSIYDKCDYTYEKIFRDN
ncbi:Tn7-like element transposition protein TnsE [Marinisporobacter balticus]|uniref:TnsE C-terminal domain-containing protein n=1 Tax=Marinisporobacter balticus TaxID=2018667 RepID=A0A4R2KE72_9FIRM|nr:Tn7-like element transposition protein TnsE [Marinisporobacter balticus]TCO71813.1 hypothetical protein EV214_12033 [Marinisporobacter balticus]